MFNCDLRVNADVVLLDEVSLGHDLASVPQALLFFAALLVAVSPRGAFRVAFGRRPVRREDRHRAGLDSLFVGGEFRLDVRRGHLLPIQPDVQGSGRAGGDAGWRSALPAVLQSRRGFQHAQRRPVSASGTRTDHLPRLDFNHLRRLAQSRRRLRRAQRGSPGPIPTSRLTHIGGGGLGGVPHRRLHQSHPAPSQRLVHAAVRHPGARGGETRDDDDFVLPPPSAGAGFGVRGRVLAVRLAGGH
mmetsp:Transcript_3710/g.9963  ORF Transcript_3710/g.9963 Transcript_3710/m.9963 type:complete len:244 (-) Transcript_3710:313-1044(-)